MYKEMRQALYYGLDREYAATQVAKVYAPQHTYFAATYFLDAESGLSVRGTPEGQAVYDKYAGSSHGYVPDAAKDLFKDAVAKAIADGHYQRGTADNYTVIEFKLIYASSDSTAFQAYIQNVMEQYEALLVDDVNYVRVTFDHQDVAFPTNYYDYAMKAVGDLVVGGISGSLLDAPGFLEVFNADDRGGFTLNWGIDTSSPNIKVQYVNLDGVEVKEYWSFDAIVEVLSRKTYVREGREQKGWTNLEDLIRAYQDMNNDQVKTIADGDQTLAEALLGKTFEDLIEEEGYAEVVAKVVTTESNRTLLYVVAKDGKDWVLVKTISLETDIKKFIEAAYTKEAKVTLTLSEDPELLDTDEKLLSNEYIAGLIEDEESDFEWTTLAEIAEAYEIELSELRVYATTYEYDGKTYSDACVVRQIGDYFLFIEWL
jgi:hypothetical protein